MTRRAYALAVLERAVKTAAQAALLVFGADQLDAMQASWADAFGFAAGGFVLSILTSLATSGFGPSGPSVTTEAVVEAPLAGERGHLSPERALVIIILGLFVLFLLFAVLPRV